MRYEYLFFNLFILFSSIIGVLLYKKATFPSIRMFLKSVVPTAIVFIIWDCLVTNYFWYFSEKYTLGIRFYTIPIEEVLFFFTIPFSCMVIYNNIQTLFPKRIPITAPVYVFITAATVILLLSIAVLCYAKPYTATITVITAASIVFFFVSHKKQGIPEKFPIFFLLLLVLTFIFDGYLTARPIVTYNPDVILGLRLWTTPIEDFLYGISMILITLSIYDLATTGKSATMPK